jgi:glyoxylase-like metal-dependent hydrolase (beta-lactamase superfamily II)
MGNAPIINGLFDEPTNTISYIVGDPATLKAAVIDPVLDYDHAAGTVDTRSVEALLQMARATGYTIEWTLETHAHADHLSGSTYIKAKTGARIGIGEHIREVQKIFRPIFNALDLRTDGSDFDHLFVDGEIFSIGELQCEVIGTPGHTPADVATRSETPFSLETLCSCRITAQLVPTFPVVMSTLFIGRSVAFWLCRQRRGSTCAMTTRRLDDPSMRGKRQ